MSIFFAIASFLGPEPPYRHSCFVQQSILLIDRHESTEAEDLETQQSLKGLAAAVGIDLGAEKGAKIKEKLRREARLYARVVASPFPGLIFSDLMRFAGLPSVSTLLLTNSPLEYGPGPVAAAKASSGKPGGHQVARQDCDTLYARRTCP